MRLPFDLESYDYLFTYDLEVTKYDWIYVAKNYETKQYHIFHNDSQALADFISEYGIYVGFNSKNYDKHIVKGVVGGLDNISIKLLSDYLVNEGNPYEHTELSTVRYNFNDVDLRNDMQQGISLKAYEGHMGMDITESSVPFDVDHPLTPTELDEMIRYCIKDVDATESLLDIRLPYLRTKLNLGYRTHMLPHFSMSLTNAKLVAKLLGAVRREWTDGREYEYPVNLDKSIIPKQILDFFDQIKDLTIPDEVLFKRALEIDIGGMKTKYAWGGVHGSLTKYYEEATATRVIQNRDVSSLYPSLVIIYDYLSRNVRDKTIFKNMRDERIEAKHRGDKQTANDLKLPLNTVTGAQENKYNDLYDAKQTRSLRISGQLFLTVLAIRLIKECKTIRLINLNTDGIAYSVDKEELPIVDRICSEWEKETEFELETDEIQKIFVKDVNNLLIVKTNNEVKTVGGYLNYGVSNKGAFGIRNNMNVVAKALKAYLVDGTPVEQTINEDNDIFDYQIIAKAGSKYSRAFQIVDGVEVPVQKVNRVYASKDTSLGLLYKVKRENGQVAKIENLPPHCIIDNKNELTIDDIDKSWYVAVAKKRITDFIGGNMATKKAATVPVADKNKNVLERLLDARVMFMAKHLKKSGKNMQQEYTYFELEDIVPLATKIFQQMRIVGVVNTSDTTASMTIYNIDNTEDVITFTLPMAINDPIISSRTGNAVTTKMQSIGASITYIRRYLYMVALDIVEHDAIEMTPVTVEAPKAVTPKTSPVVPKTVSVTPVQREEIKQAITDTEGNATEMQLTALKRVCADILKAHPEKEPDISKVAIQTKGFTEISKSRCEMLLVALQQMAKE